MPSQNPPAFEAEDRGQSFAKIFMSSTGTLPCPASRLTLFLITQHGDVNAGSRTLALDFHDTRNHWWGIGGHVSARRGRWEKGKWHPGTPSFLRSSLKNSFSNSNSTLPFSCPTFDCRVGKGNSVIHRDMMCIAQGDKQDRLLGTDEPPPMDLESRGCSLR